MDEFIVKYAELFFANWQTVLWGGLIVVSAVIALLGLLKPLFNKIPNKLVRKVSLAFSSLAMALPMTALSFFIENISFEHYWVGAGAYALSTILCYWLYENTGARNFLHFVGKKVLTMLGKLFITFLNKEKDGFTTEDRNYIKAESKKVKDEVKSSLTNDLKNL